MTYSNTLNIFLFSLKPLNYSYFCVKNWNVVKENVIILELRRLIRELPSILCEVLLYQKQCHLFRDKTG